jgi:hypothetical protein
MQIQTVGILSPGDMGQAIATVLNQNVLSTLKLSYCVASNSGHNWLKEALGKTDLLPYFSGKIFSATEVSRSKPYPDVFLYAAETMGFFLQECLVIEDTPTGVKAGVHANMTVFGYAELINPEKLREVGASVVFNLTRSKWYRAYGTFGRTKCPNSWCECRTNQGGILTSNTFGKNSQAGRDCCTGFIFSLRSGLFNYWGRDSG